MSFEISHFNFLIERGRFAAAEGLVRKALAKEPDDADLHIGLSLVLRRLDRPKEAQDAARRAIGLAPDWGLAHEALADALLASGNLKEAEKSVNEAIAIDGDSADRRVILARIYQLRERYEIMLEHSNAGLSMDPDHDVCRFFRTIALGSLGRHDEADKTAMELLADDPEDSANHSARGWILLDRNAVAEAKMHFQEALRLDPDNGDGKAGLARCLQQGNPVLGWLLRLILRLDRIPVMNLMLFAVVFGIVLPNYLSGKNQPDWLRITGMVIRTAFMTFFNLCVVAGPAFDCLLVLSKEGRAALGTLERRAVRWIFLPLVVGLVYLGIWASKGSPLPPYVAMGCLGTAALLHTGFCNRHPWVRRRMLAIAGGAGIASLWFIFGPPIIMNPIAAGLGEKLEPGAPESMEILRGRLEHLLRVSSWFFIYPALLIYIAASYSENLAEALQRRAPDEPE